MTFEHMYIWGAHGFVQLAEAMDCLYIKLRYAHEPALLLPPIPIDESVDYRAAVMLGKQYLEGREYRTANPKRVRSLVNQCQHYQSGRVHLQLLHAGRPGDYGLRIFKPIRRRNVRQYIRHVSSHDLR